MGMGGGRNWPIEIKPKCNSSRLWLRRSRSRAYRRSCRIRRLSKTKRFHAANQAFNVVRAGSHERERGRIVGKQGENHRPVKRRAAGGGGRDQINPVELFASKGVVLVGVQSIESA